jgi:hypothetical protein
MDQQGKLGSIYFITENCDVTFYVLKLVWPVLLVESWKICFKMVGLVTEVQNHDKNLEETACIQKITLKATQFVWF